MDNKSKSPTKNQNPNSINLKGIICLFKYYSLDIFTEEEIVRFLKETDSKFESLQMQGNKKSVLKTSSNKSPLKKINSLLLDRSTLILRLLKIAKQKLSYANEHFLVKGITWLTNQISESLLFKSDELTIQKLDTLKKENTDMKCLFSWLEEYSTIKINQIGKDKLKHVSNSKNLSLTDVKQILTSPTTSNDLFKLGNIISFSEESISHIEEQTFNIFKLEEEIGKENTLSVISCYLFTTYGLYSLIKYDKFEKFVKEITRGYNRDNPYHNDLHAADISQTCMIYLKYGNMKEIFKFDDFDQCSLFISCIVHDYKHPGYNNGFLINTSDAIAIRYNDSSVLENYHVAQTFKLIKSNDSFNIFSDLKKEEFKVVRQRMVRCILATDMIFHAKQFSFLKLKIEKYSISKGENMLKLIEGLDKLNLFALQQEFLDIIIHACDISNPTKPFEMYTYWADKVMEEFWRQGDKEKELGLSVSFLCDRNTSTKAQGQVGFMEGVVGPYFSAFVECFPGLYFLTENVEINKGVFRKMKEEEEQQKKMKEKEKDKTD